MFEAGWAAKRRSVETTGVVRDVEQELTHQDRMLADAKFGHGTFADRDAPTGTSDGPDAIGDLLARVHDSGLRADTARHAELAVLARYERLSAEREAQLRREFLADRSEQLAREGMPADVARATARGQVDDYLLSARAQRAMTSAEAETARWADKVGLIERFRRADAVPPRADTAAFPDGLRPALARIESRGVSPQMLEQAERKLYERYQECRRAPEERTHQAMLRRTLTELKRAGYPPEVGDWLARREADAYVHSPKTQQNLDSVAVNNTDQWMRQATLSAIKGDDAPDWIADIYSRDVRPLPELIQGTHDYLDTVQDRLNALVERSPELLDKGADRWQAALEATRDRVTALADEAAAADADTSVIRSVLQGNHTGVQGIEGEVQMAAKLDNIHDLGAEVDVRAPMGARLTSEVDIVTDEGRVWHEVKTAGLEIQPLRERTYETQARRQLAISHMNREYWVDGKPPEHQWHFMNGVDPQMKAKIEAVRIEGENGYPLDDHRIRVIDEASSP
ncbi:hypothetical protein K8O92_13890 [Nocardia asteroides]|nr:hypothetical protein K8O92_13890 [Nocardia asteroides]